MKGFLVFLFSIFVFLSSAAHARGGAIVFVDREKIVSQALVFKSVGQQIDDKRIALQKEFSEKEGQLRKKDEELQHQKSVLSADKKEKKEEEFRQEVLSVQKDAAAKRSELEKMYLTSMKKMHSKVREISQNIAKKEGYSMVLFVLKDDQVLYSDDDVDISGKILTELNKLLPDLDVNNLNE